MPNSATQPPAEPETEVDRGQSPACITCNTLSSMRRTCCPRKGPSRLSCIITRCTPSNICPSKRGCGAGLIRSEPTRFCPEEHYRQCLVSGRIRHEELAAVLVDDLGDQADILLGLLGTRFKLRMAMLEYPVQLAPAAELRWLVEETDALRRFPNFAHGPSRLRMVAETRHWVMRDLRRDPRLERASAVPSSRIEQHVQELFTLFGRSSVERWADDTWESFCLHLLWRICLDGSHAALGRTSKTTASTIRLAEQLKQLTHEDCDRWVHEMLIRFCAAFLDQGYAQWRLPDREQGFYASFSQLYRQPGGPPNRWLRGLRRELWRVSEAGLSPLQSIEESLQLFGISEDEWEPFIVATLQALPGWAGMIWQMESNAEWTMFPAPAGSLVEYLAVRLILDRLAASELARQSLDWQGNLRELPVELSRQVTPRRSQAFEQHAYMAFRMAQVCDWLPRELSQLPPAQWKMLLKELEDFSSFERRRIFHRAYERRYRNQVLDGLIVHRQGRRPWPHESGPHRQLVETGGKLRRPAARAELNLPRDWDPETTPSFQIICCIDDREESFRRHLEEVDPCCETFGAAGFFGVAMYYKGATDAHARPFCPVDHQAAALRATRRWPTSLTNTGAARETRRVAGSCVAPFPFRQPYILRRHDDRDWWFAGIDSDGDANPVSAQHRTDSSHVQAAGYSLPPRRDWCWNAALPNRVPKRTPWLCAG